MNRGDVCRAECDAPARYVGDGLCLFVSAQDNAVYADSALPATGDEKDRPLPSDQELAGAVAMLAYFRGFSQWLNAEDWAQFVGIITRAPRDFPTLSQLLLTGDRKVNR